MRKVLGLVTAAALSLGSCVSREGPRAAAPSDQQAEPECTAEEIEVIRRAGSAQGLLDAGQGTRRLLVIPPELAYPDGSDPIKPGETLVFVVDVLTVTGP